MELSSKELEDFNENGYLVLRNFLDENSCDKILEKAKVHLENKREPIETESEYIGEKKDFLHITVRRLRQVYDRDELFASWMKNSKIYPILKQILGENPVITTAHHNSIMTKIPNLSTQTSWHQDFRYWSFENDNLVSVWLALGEENSDNGVLEFVPKSHKISFSKEQFEEKEYFSATHPKNIELIKTKKSTTLNKGDIILFHCKLLHRANKNSSNKTKISFVYTVKGESNDALKNSRSSSFKEIKLR